jgi:hypothetical protein
MLAAGWRARRADARLRMRVGRRCSGRTARTPAEKKTRTGKRRRPSGEWADADASYPRQHESGGVFQSGEEFSAPPANGQAAPAGQNGAAAATGAPSAPAASKFPFPGEDSAGKPENGNGPLKDSGSSGSSSSSSSSSSQAGHRIAIRRRGRWGMAIRIQRRRLRRLGGRRGRSGGLISTRRGPARERGLEGGRVLPG